jgi:hypothetical protein
MSADTPVIDLGYRKRTHVIAAIKGERRRSAIRDAFDADRVTPLDALYATPTLPDEHRRALGRLHPSFMGKDRIRYRVVDEYNGDTLSEQRTRSSKRPLSLGVLSAESYRQLRSGSPSMKTLFAPCRGVICRTAPCHRCSNRTAARHPLPR